MDSTSTPANPVPSPEPAPQIQPQAAETPQVGLPSTPSDVITPTAVTKASKPFTLILIGLLLVVLIVGTGYFGYKFYKHSHIPVPQAAVYTPIVAKASASPTPNASDNSDAALNQDTKSVDASLNSVDSELTTVDQSMTDQEGDLSGN